MKFELNTEFKCPKCGQVLSLTAQDVAVGSKLQCGGCDFRFAVIAGPNDDGEWNLVPDIAEIDGEHIT